MSASGPAAPDCAAPPAQPVAPRQQLPHGSCDTHVHVFGPQSRYPLDARRGYTPHVCTLDDYRRVMHALGIERAVLVQPSVYGTDNRALLDALRAGGAAFRGVVVPAADISDAELRDMHALGVRGVRLNLVNPQVLGVDDAVRLCARVAPLGWHLQLQLGLGPEGVTALRALAPRIDVPLVIDHAGRVPPGADAQPLLDLLGSGNCWVKLSAPYRSSARPFPHEDVTPLMAALVAARPDRLLWASDWPHTEQLVATPHAGALVDLLYRWIPDPATLRRICVDNPARLYGF